MTRNKLEGIWVLVVILVAGAVALFINNAVQASSDGTLRFPTQNDAAIAALQLVNDMSSYYEGGGVIVRAKSDGKYLIGFPVTDYAGDRLNINSDPLPFSKTGVVVATFHTHPCLPVSHVPNMFSPQDTEAARIEKLAAYMGDLCTGDVHLYDPAVDKIPEPNPDSLAEALGIDQPLTPGRIIGHIKVVGLPLERVKSVNPVGSK